MDYQEIFSIEPGKIGGQPCIRHLQITINDIPDWPGPEMTIEEIIDNFPELFNEDIYAALHFDADRAQKTLRIAS